MSTFEAYLFMRELPFTEGSLQQLQRFKPAFLSEDELHFFYSWNEFLTDPLEVLAEHADALIYMANWGERRLAFRLDPEAFSAVKSQIEVYLYEDKIMLFELQEGGAILDLNLDHCDAGDEDFILIGMNARSYLFHIRKLILQGDLRPLWIARCKALLLEWEQEFVLAWDEEDVESQVLLEMPPWPERALTSASADSCIEVLQLFFELFEPQRQRMSQASWVEQKAQLTFEEELEPFFALLPRDLQQLFAQRLSLSTQQLNTVLDRFELEK